MERNLWQWRIVDLFVQVAKVVLIEALILDFGVVTEGMVAKDLEVPSIDFGVVTTLEGDPSGVVIIMDSCWNGWVLRWQ